MAAVPIIKSTGEGLMGEGRTVFNTALMAVVTIIKFRYSVGCCSVFGSIDGEGNSKSGLSDTAFSDS